ncbi:MAG: MarR family transcriptional regulator [Pseudomonadota bacterium]
MDSDDLNRVAVAALAFNRWAKDSLPVSNSIMALDVLLGIYLAERRRPDPTTFKELCWDLRHSEQAIRTIVDRLQESGWVQLEQDTRFRRSISRLRIAPQRADTLKAGLELLRHNILNGKPSYT